MRKWYFLLLITALMSCDSSRIFEEFRELESFWRTEQTLSYSFEIEDVNVSYSVIAEIKNDLTYPYRNFYFNYTLQSASDSVVNETLREIQLFEPKTGKPFGSGIGDQYNNEIVLEEKIQFPASGEYRIDLQQFMRIDSLPGIKRVGVRVQQVQ